MADKRPKLAKLLAADKFPPKGILKYPRLNVADTKFNDKGVYTTKLILSAEVAAPMMAAIEAAAAAQLVQTRADLNEELEEVKGEKKGKLKKQIAELALASMPFKPVFDDAGEENGDIEFSFKMAASYIDKTTKEVKTMKPKLYDSKGKALDPAPQIWGGTVARVSAELNPFYKPLTGVGVSLRLSAVQIIKLVSGSQGASADSFGFGEEEGGYESDESKGEFDAQETTTAVAASGDTDEEQF